jgi:hypothetical protein
VRTRQVTALPQAGERRASLRCLTVAASREPCYASRPSLVVDRKLPAGMAAARCAVVILVVSEHLKMCRLNGGFNCSWQALH